MPPRDMSAKQRLQPGELGPEDFDAIREAVMETARGRWFLDQYAARLRAAETQGLVAGMKRLETALSSNHDALMARLAAALDSSPATPRATTVEPALAPRHMKYFRKDEDIFEPAPHAQIAAVPDLSLLPDLPPEPAHAPEAEAQQKRRIVIIRHKPGEQIDVPLADELAKAS
jgi:hypothetical protein